MKIITKVKHAYKMASEQIYNKKKQCEGTGQRRESKRKRSKGRERREGEMAVKKDWKSALLCLQPWAPVRFSGSII